MITDFILNFLSMKRIIVIGVVVLAFIAPDQRELIIGGLLGFLTDSLIEGENNAKN